MVGLPLVETGCAGLQVDRTRRSEVLCRLEHGALLPVVERHGLHVVEREAPQIDRSVLGVPQLDAVVEDPDMVRAHAPDIDRLQSPDSAVVLDLDSGEVAQGVGHVVRRELVELLARELLYGDDLLADDMPRHDDLLDLLEAVEPALSGRRTCESHTCRKGGK